MLPRVCALVVLGGSAEAVWLTSWRTGASHWWVMTPSWQKVRGSCSFRLRQTWQLLSVSDPTPECLPSNAAAFLTSTLGIWLPNPKCVPNRTHQTILCNVTAFTQPLWVVPSALQHSSFQTKTVHLFLFPPCLKNDSRMPGNPKGHAFKNNAQNAGATCHLPQSNELLCLGFYSRALLGPPDKHIPPRDQF